MPKQDWKAYFPDDGQTADDAAWIMSVWDADQAANEAVEYDWSSRDGWERGEGTEFTVIVISPANEEFRYIGYHEPDVRHVAERDRSAPTSGDRNAPPNDCGLLETNLIHPHPRQDGQQCDHPGGESLTVENAPIGTKAPAFGGGYWILVSDGAWKWSSGSSLFPRPGGDWNGFLIPPPTLGDRTALPSEQTVLKQ